MTREDHLMTSDALRRSANATDDLRTMSKNYQHEGGAYWPAFDFNWAADEIDALEAYIIKHVFKIWPGGIQHAPDDDPIREISRRYSERTVHKHWGAVIKDGKEYVVPLTTEAAKEAGWKSPW